MSEDSFRIEFSHEDMSKKSTKNEFEEIYRKYVPEEVISNSESSISYKGKKATYFAGFFDIDSYDINNMIQELDTAGAKDVIASAWYDSAGEEMFFLRVGGEFLEFESKDEVDSYMAEQKNTPSDIDISYGKDNNKNILLCRLHIKAKSKRNKLYTLFESAKNMTSSDHHSAFVSGFDALTKSDSHDITWCKFKWKDDQSWNEVASQDFIYGLVDVVEEDEYLYLAFDTEKLEGNFKLDDYVYFVLFNLDGVKKVWIKYWRGSVNKCMYLYHPGMGDESFFMRRELLDDNQWPK